MDAWIESFIDKRHTAANTMPVIADRLAAELYMQLEASGLSWDQMRQVFMLQASLTIFRIFITSILALKKRASTSSGSSSTSPTKRI